MEGSWEEKENDLAINPCLDVKSGGECTEEDNMGVANIKSGMGED